MTDLAAIQVRVEKGIEWLTEHDPTGSFHAWFEMKIAPNDAKPAQTPERRAEYVQYYGARVLFEQLWREMERLEKVRDG